MIAMPSGPLNARIRVRQVEVLVDSTRIVHDPVAVDEHRDAALLRQLDDLGAIAAPERDALGPVGEALPAQAPGDRAAGAEEVGRDAAAIEDPGLRAFGQLCSVHPSPTLSPSCSMRPKPRSAKSVPGALPPLSPSRSACQRMASSSVSSCGRGLNPSSFLALVAR